MVSTGEKSDRKYRSENIQILNRIQNKQFIMERTTRERGGNSNQFKSNKLNHTYR